MHIFYQLKVSNNNTFGTYMKDPIIIYLFIYNILYIPVYNIYNILYTGIYNILYINKYIIYTSI